MTAERSPITLTDFADAQKIVVERLDRSFFCSRLERLTEPEKKYLQAIASLDTCPSYRSSDVAKAMGKKTREALIAKGKIYSPSYGRVAFTVPLFDDLMRRIH